ncbi:hypothetical protein WDU94_001248 [Cyamophila willieti]
MSGTKLMQSSSALSSPLPPVHSPLTPADSEDYMTHQIMDVMRMCAGNPLLASPSTLIQQQNGKTAEALYYIQSTMEEIDPGKKGLSGKDIIHHVTENSGKQIDAQMKRQIRAELMRGVRSGDLKYVDDEYTRRKYYVVPKF